MVEVRAHESADHQVVFERPAMGGTKQQPAPVSDALMPSASSASRAMRASVADALVQSFTRCHIAVPLVAVSP